MRLSFEAKIGIFLALVYGFGTGAVIVWPDQLWIGRLLMVGSLFGFIVLCVFHLYELYSDRKDAWRFRRMTAFIAMVIFGMGTVTSTVIYLWTPKSASHDATANLSPDELLALRAHNFSRGLRNFRSEFLADEDKWQKMEWNYNPDGLSAEENKERETRNLQRSMDRMQQFTRRFHQAYKQEANALADDLNARLKILSIIPNPKEFRTPLPPGFDTFKTTLNSPAIQANVSQNYIARMAEYFDILAELLPIEGYSGTKDHQGQIVLTPKTLTPPP